MRPHRASFPAAHRPGRDARGERAELRARSGATQTGVPAMNDSSTKSPDGNKPRLYAVGYGKPPVHTRFRKGVSGNQRGGSRAQRAARATALAMKEAYRLVTVREGDKVTSLPAIQAV